MGLVILGFMLQRVGCGVQRLARAGFVYEWPPDRASGFQELRSLDWGKGAGANKR